MKEGAWIIAETGNWHWVDDHADWVRRPECARSAGLPEDAVIRIADMPRRTACGPERTAIILEAMRYGLIRFRGHGVEVTFESTLPLEVVVPAVAGFMAEHFGPLTWVRFNQFPEGPCIGVTYQVLLRALESCDLSCLVDSGWPAAPETPVQKGAR
jgi:hypothetical protein